MQRGRSRQLAQPPTSSTDNSTKNPLVSPPELAALPQSAAPAVGLVGGAERRIIWSNPAFGALWNLEAAWLQNRPRWTEVLDRLRIAGKLPEQRDFKSWKTAQLARMNSMHGDPELWHLSGGTSLRVSIQPVRPRTALILFDDVSDRLRWERACRSLQHVQKAMLALQEYPAAVFGPDGRLKSCNDHFARLCQLEQKDREGQPHVRELASRPLAVDQEGLWLKILEAIGTSDPARLGEAANEPGHRGPAQHRFARLPDGTTLLQLLLPQLASGQRWFSHTLTPWQADPAYCPRVEPVATKA